MGSGVLIPRLLETERLPVMRRVMVMIVMIMMMANMVMVRRIAMMMGTMCCACNFKVKP